MDLYRAPKMNIYSATDGEVLFSGYNGGNGNMLLIHHGLALYTIYCHCSELLVKKGSRVKAGELIAKSGTTGYSLGDHLHFGVLIQNKYVNPTQWMSSKWLTKNILHPIRLAEKYISDEKEQPQTMIADKSIERVKQP